LVSEDDRFQSCVATSVVAKPFDAIRGAIGAETALDGYQHPIADHLPVTSAVLADQRFLAKHALELGDLLAQIAQADRIEQPRRKGIATPRLPTS